MALFEAAVRQLLLGDPGVTGIVGSKVYPVLAREDTDYPFVLLQRVATTQRHQFGADGGLRGATLQISCYSRDYDEALNLAQACRSALQDKSGVIASADIDRIVIDAEHDTRAETDTRAFGRLVEVVVYGRE